MTGLCPICHPGLGNSRVRWREKQGSFPCAPSARDSEVFERPKKSVQLPLQGNNKSHDLERISSGSRDTNTQKSKQQVDFDYFFLVGGPSSEGNSSRIGEFNLGSRKCYTQIPAWTHEGRGGLNSYYNNNYYNYNPTINLKIAANQQNDRTTFTNDK